MRARAVVLGGLILLGAAALIVYLATSRSDTTFTFSFHDAVSGGWVWNSTVRLEDRADRIFYQSDAGPVPVTLSHLKPGPATLRIVAPGYPPVAIPVALRRGANRLDKPIAMPGQEIPGLDHFVVFEQPEAGDLVGELRPVGTDGKAVVNHPCLPIRLEARITEELRSGAPAQEPAETGNTRGRELFSGEVDWQWDGAPETVFRYRFRVPASAIRSSDAPYRVVDYVIRVPGAPRAFTDTSWNVPGRPE